MDSSIDKSFDENGLSLSIVSKNVYNSDLSPSINSKISNGDVYTEELYYPYDVSNIPLYSDDEKNIIKGFLYKNIRSEVILKKSFLNNKKLEEKFNKYKDFSSMLFPMESISVLDDGQKYTEVLYHSYDDKGNVTSYTNQSGVLVSAMWAYNKSYPLAVAVNVSKSILDSAIQYSLQMIGETSLDVFLNKIDLYTPLGKERWSLFTRYVQEYNGVVSSNGMITLYAYRPLIGVVCKTDHNQINAYYKYDIYGRLEAIVDYKGNTVNQYKYQ